MVALDAASNSVIVKLEYDYKDVGVKKMQEDLDALRRKQIGQTGAGKGPLEGPERARQMYLTDRLARQQKQQARAQREVLFSGLGVMFFMMSLSRVLNSLIQPAAEIAGIFEIIELILTLLFLPIMIKLIPILLGFLKVVGDLPTPLKELIGIITLIGLAVATVIGSLAQLSIFLGAIGMPMAGLSAALAAMAVPLLVLTGAIVGFLVYKTDIERFFLDLTVAIQGFLASLPGFPSAPAGFQPAQTALNEFGAAAQTASLLGLAGVALSAPELIEKGGRAVGELSNFISVNIFNSPGVQTTSTDIGQNGAGNASVNVAG